jgi:hypothetical protein
VYDGEWGEDKAEGWGVKYFANADRHEGEYRSDLREGRGTYTWANGDSYEGHWCNGEQSGLGTYRYAIDDVYEGNWANGRKHGRGFLLVAAESKVYFEVWRLGQNLKHDEMALGDRLAWPSLETAEADFADEDDDEGEPPLLRHS